MRIEAKVRNSNFRECISAEGVLLDRQISHSITADFRIFFLEEDFEFEDVPLIETYFDLKDNLVESFIMERESHIRIEYESVLSLFPTISGVEVRPLSPPLEEGAIADKFELVELAGIREMISKIGDVILSDIARYRHEIVSIFEHGQSQLLFDLLKLIDKSSVIRSYK